MKIAVLGSKSLPAFAGADRVAENILHHLPADDGRHYHIYVVRTPAQPRPFDYAPNIRVIPVPAMAGKHSRATTFFLLSALHCALVLRPALAHAHDSAFGPFAWILRLLRPRMPILGTFHATPTSAPNGAACQMALRFLNKLHLRLHQLTTVAGKGGRCQARSRAPVSSSQRVNPTPAISRPGWPPARRINGYLTLLPAWTH